MIKKWELPASGEIVLQSNPADWKYIVSGRQGGVIRGKAFIKIGPPKKEVNILIEEFFEPNSLGANVWILIGYFLGDKRTPMIMTYSPKDEKTFYVSMKQEDKDYFFSCHSCIGN